MAKVMRFTTTWDYTTLKPNRWLEECQHSFTTTWDYTTLKPARPGF